eukprot:19756-Heterococcus_DN1.PRE.1
MLFHMRAKKRPLRCSRYCKNSTGDANAAKNCYSLQLCAYCCSQETIMQLQNLIEAAYIWAATACSWIQQYER